MVELLVVLAICAALAVLCLPVFGKVKSASQSTKCLSNLREIGVALQSYRAEHNGVMPEVYDSATTYYWFHQLLGTAPGAQGNRYLASPGVLSCPASDRSDAAFGTTPPTPVSYGMMDPVIWYPALHRSQADPHLYLRIQNLSRWPVVMDADTWAIYSLDNPSANAARDSRFTARHNGKAHLLMADGHIEQAAYGDTRWQQGTLNGLVQ